MFEYMDHDLTGLSDRPGLRFTVPQIKACRNSLFIDICNYLGYSSFLLKVSYLSVLYETVADWAPLLSCQ